MKTGSPRDFREYAVLGFLLCSLLTTYCCAAAWRDMKKEDVDAYVAQYLPSFLERTLREIHQSNRLASGKNVADGFRNSAKALKAFGDISSHSQLSNQARFRTSQRLHQEAPSVYEPHYDDKSPDLYDADEAPSVNTHHKRETEVPSKYIEERLQRLFPKLAKRLAKIPKIRNLVNMKPNLDLIENMTFSFPPEVQKELESLSLESLSQCDAYQSDSRTCWFNRQVGDTLTLKVRLLGAKNLNWTGGRIVLMWEKVHHSTDSRKDVREKLHSGTTNESTNVVVGSGGFRLRISPIKDIDMDLNSFVVSARAVPLAHFSSDGMKLADMTFRINVVPIDMGFVYLGEELTIAIDNYMTLPPGSASFVWMLEKSLSDVEGLPPNMRVKDKGRVLVITELSSEQQGVVACAVYSAQELFLAKRRFLIRRPALPSAEHTPNTAASFLEFAHPRNVTDRKKNLF